MDNCVRGAKIVKIDYAEGNRGDTMGEDSEDGEELGFLFGDILRTPRDAKMEIRKIPL